MREISANETAINGTIAQRLRAARKQAKITQAEFGDIFGVSATSVVTWESGKKQFTATDIIAFSEFFKLSPLYFLRELCPGEQDFDRLWYKVRTEMPDKEKDTLNILSALLCR